MTFPDLLALNAGVVLATMIGLWLVALRLRDVSFIDAFWAFNMGLVAVVDWFAADGDPTRQALLTGLCLAWALRLGGHLFMRWRRQGEDRRYASLLGRLTARGLPGWAASLVFVFLLQGVLLLLVSLPVQIGQAFDHPPVGPLGWAGATLAAFGVAFEAVADHQLARFRASPDSAGQVMDRGLWRYTRHPNYFGDACVWFGLWLVACDHPLGFALTISPLLMTYFLVKVTGKALLERRLKRAKPDYAAYVARTSGFFPLPPKG